MKNEIQTKIFKLVGSKDMKEKEKLSAEIRSAFSMEEIIRGETLVLTNFRCAIRIFKFDGTYIEYPSFKYPKVFINAACIRITTDLDVRSCSCDTITFQLIIYDEKSDSITSVFSTETDYFGYLMFNLYLGFTNTICTEEESCSENSDVVTPEVFAIELIKAFDNTNVRAAMCLPEPIYRKIMANSQEFVINILNEYEMKGQDCMLLEILKNDCQDLASDTIRKNFIENIFNVWRRLLSINTSISIEFGVELFMYLPDYIVDLIAQNIIRKWMFDFVEIDPRFIQDIDSSTKHKLFPGFTAWIISDDDFPALERMFNSSENMRKKILNNIISKYDIYCKLVVYIVAVFVSEVSTEYISDYLIKLLSNSEILEDCDPDAFKRLLRAYERVLARHNKYAYPSLICLSIMVSIYNKLSEKNGGEE